MGNNGSSGAKRATADITPLGALSVTLTSFTIIKADKENPTYAMVFSSWRCEVKNLSTIHFVAVRSQDRDKSTFPPHCGLMLKNKFYLENGKENKRHVFDYLLAHAFIKRTSSTEDETTPTKLVLFFCKSQEEVYEQLKSVHHNFERADRGISPGVESYTSCATLVELIKNELKTPFDLNWDQHLKRSVGRSSDDVTNCALFAARIFKDLMPSSEQRNYFSYIQLAFREINLQHLLSAYR